MCPVAHPGFGKVRGAQPGAKGAKPQPPRIFRFITKNIPFSGVFLSKMDTRSGALRIWQRRGTTGDLEAKPPAANEFFAVFT